jgi:hypothetical protein
VVFCLDYVPRICDSLAYTKSQRFFHISHISVSLDVVYTQIALRSTFAYNIVSITDKVFNQPNSKIRRWLSGQYQVSDINNLSI